MTPCPAKTHRFQEVVWPIRSTFVLLALMIAALPVLSWAHGEIEGAGESKIQRTVQGKTGKYRFELTVSPSVPVAGDDTNMEMHIVRVLPKPDPLLGSEVPVTTKPDLSVVTESSKQTLDRSVSVHEEGEAGVFGVDGYRFGDSGSLLLRFVIHSGAGEDFTLDLPLSVKTNVAAIFRLWVNLAVGIFIAGLIALRLWKIRHRGGERREMARPVAVGLICWLAAFGVMNYFVIDKVVALRKPKVVSAAPPSVVGNEDGSYTISADAQKTLGIVLTDAKEIGIERGIRAYGAVEARPDLASEIVAPLWGRVEFSKDSLAVGDKVKKGQELVRVVLELSQVERAPMEAKQTDIKGGLLRAKGRRDGALAEFERAKKLFAADPAYEQDMKWAKEIYDDAEDAYQTIDKEDKGYVGVIKFRDPRRTPVVSPIDGTITFIGFTPGQLNLNGEYLKLFSIVDTSAVWVRASVLLTDVWRLKSGGQVSIHPVANPNDAMPGTIHWIGDTVDAVNRTVPVLIDVANSSGRLALNSYVEVEFPHARQRSVAIPDRAVVDDGATKRIYMAVASDKFQPVNVDLGVKKDGWWEVVSGVQVGDRVISSGAGLLGAVHAAAPEAQFGDHADEKEKPIQPGSAGATKPVPPNPLAERRSGS